MNSIRTFSIKFGTLFSFLLIALASNAQLVNVIHVDKTNPPKISVFDGVFYSLPQTIIKLDFIIEKQTKIKGPYAEFSEKYLGTDDVIESNSVNYYIRDVKLSTYQQPDPNNIYFVEIDTKPSKEERSFLMSLNESGLIVSSNNIFKTMEDDLKIFSWDIERNVSDHYFDYFADYNLYEKTDTIVRTVNIDTITIEDLAFKRSIIEKDIELKAKNAAKFIQKLREDRMNLLTGYQEVNYEKGSFEYMGSELKNLEKEYLDLFRGISFSETLNYSYSYTPDSENYEEVRVLKFSSLSGVFDASISGGESIFVKIQNSGSAQVIKNYLSSQTNENVVHGFYYRIPEHAKISVECDNRILAKKSCIINQLGVVSFLPLSKSKIRFNPKTGGINELLIE
ncbi:MAG: DUF4831 family protein [Bacteroidales bacterium]|nr:DUF4831 family protein [Bacteroidales bacterium]